MTGKIKKRHLQAQIENWFFEGKIIVLYGARQVGKTTLCKQILKKHDGVYFSCEQENIKSLLRSRNISAFKLALNGKKLVVFDEAQKLIGIGEILKLFIDECPEIQIIATGSSSFDLANQTAEPLTGRKITFTLYPFSIKETGVSILDFSEKITEIMQFGLYPDIFNTHELQKKQQKLNELASDYLYKDVLEFENLKKSDLLMKLLKALALQVGSEVSYRELAQLLDTSGETILRYLNLLEKSFVIYRLASFSRNLRKELVRKQKIYFYDLGIRNSLIQNFAPLDLRTDTGFLWENFCIIERLKHNQAQNLSKNYYFWRTYDQKEIDFIEESNGKLEAFEMKWSTKNKRVKVPKDFLETYPKSSFSVINPDNFFQDWV